MRLIDIDKHFELNKSFYKADIEMPLHRVKVALESLPTVKAIPVEYIKAFKKEIKDVTNGEAVIDWLLENWEKENETN